MKHTLIVFGLGLVPATAFAQVPVYPSGQATQPPVELSPSLGGSQAPPAPAAPAAVTPRPNVIVVKPDGTVSEGPAPGGPMGDAPGGYYVEGGNSNVMPAGEDSDVVRAGPVPELHVVRTGDTLWDICTYYFNDPWQWPKIWSYNAQVTNPHWIYPGDLVRLLPRGVFANQGSGDKEPEGGNDVKPIDRVPPPSRTTQVAIQQVAFIENKDLDKSITIDGAVDEKELLGTGDSVYLSYPASEPPKVGQKYSIYVPGNKVKHLGSYVHILGELQVVSVKQDKRARGIITQSNVEITRGAKVGPIVKQYKSVPPVAPTVDAQGSIVARLIGEQIIGEGEIVFIDQGAKAGLVVGNHMFVVRRGDAIPPKAKNMAGQDDRRFPARALGQIAIVEVGDKVSVGLVTVSVQEIELGDTVIMQKP